MDETMEKAKRISKLLGEINRGKEILCSLVNEEYFSVHSGNQTYIVQDKSVIETTIDSYKSLLAQKTAELDELINGDLNKISSYLKDRMSQK